LTVILSNLQLGFQQERGPFAEIELAVVFVYEHKGYTETQLIDAKATSLPDSQSVGELDLEVAGIPCDRILAAKVKELHIYDCVGFALAEMLREQAEEAKLRRAEASSK
jgi:hypothetical protein